MFYSRFTQIPSRGIVSTFILLQTVNKKQLLVDIYGDIEW